MAPVKTNIEQALETMKASGLKYTKKRELLMSYLIKRNRYVSAREVKPLKESVMIRFIVTCMTLSA